MRKIADRVGAYLLADMAHISGLVSEKNEEKCDSMRHCDLGLIVHMSGLVSESQRV
jgi:glycine/serine hydroxymethyltransferase